MFPPPLVRPFPGLQQHFAATNAPPESTERCADPCPASDTCRYNLTGLYTNPKNTGWPAHTITDSTDPKQRLEAYRTSPYSCCVYKTGTNIADRQTVTIETSDGTIITYTIHGHGTTDKRTITYHGTHGHIKATAGPTSTITTSNHQTKTHQKRTYTPDRNHKDTDMIHNFLQNYPTGKQPNTDWAESLLLGFAAEQSRKTGDTINLTAPRNYITQP